MKTNILITGTTGFIGSHLLKALPDDIQPFFLLSSRHKNEICNDKTFVFQDDISDLATFLTKNNIEGILHLASFFVSQHQTDQCKNLVDSNVFLGMALLEAATQAKVSWFINTGTFWQHFDCGEQTYNPVNLYASTKQAFEDIARYYIETSDIKFVTLKICDTYGENDTRKKIMSLLKEVAESGQVLAMSKGEQLINILYIDDVVDGFLQLISMLRNKNEVKREYKLSAEKEYSLRDIVSQFELISQKKLNIEWGARPYRQREVMCPWHKGFVLPGWGPKVSLQEGIKRFINEK